MENEDQLIFSPFRLDPGNACLWHGTQAITLTPKAFAVLHHLVKQAGRLVSKEELLDAVWQRSYVSDAVLKINIQEIRRALQDDARAPRFIETVHRRGYRFIAEVSTGAPQADKTSVPAIAPEKAPPARGAKPFLDTLVGREIPLAHLQTWFERALQGARQLVFVTGEPGIGKTTLIEAFTHPLAAAEAIQTVRGQCIEHYGAGEPYLPVFEALGQLGRSLGSERLSALLKQYGPTWLAQMPWLLAPADRDELEREILGATRERMLREMAEVLERLCMETPLVLVLEDLHWSDYATLDLISYLARRPGPARLLLIGTYRPVEAIVRGHPLHQVKQDLKVRGQCEELSLDLLSEEDVANYLARRFPENDLPADLARLIHRRTDGNPLFMVNVVDYEMSRGLILREQGRWRIQEGLEAIEADIPESLRQMIEKQIEGLSAEQQRLLETASVAGMEFSAASAAAGLEIALEQVEAQCEELARHAHMLRPSGIEEWPDGTVAGGYAFTHALYQNVLYQRLTAARCVQLHRRIGEREEAAYGEQAGEIAADLALHFERGRDYPRTIRYLRQAAENAARRYANQEAVDFLSKALKLVAKLSEGEGAEVRMSLLEQRGLVRRSMADMQGAADDFGALAAQARQQGQAEREARALIYQTVALSWISREQCLKVLAQAEELCNRLEDTPLKAYLCGWSGYWNLLWRGFRDEYARDCAAAVETARKEGDSKELSHLLGRYSYFQALCSDYRKAGQTAQEGLQKALEAGDVFDYLASHFFLVWALFHLGEWGQMRRLLEDGIGMAEKNGQHLWATLFRLELAWLHEHAFDWEKALRLCTQGLARAHQVRHSYGELLGTVLLGQVHLDLGHHGDALACFDEISQRLGRERLLMDWILKMPLYKGVSDYWLIQRDYAKARQAAEKLCQLAAEPGERTWLSLGHLRLAESAMAERLWDKAEAELSQALARLQGVEAPLAAWQVYATAAAFRQRQGHRAEAEKFYRRSAKIIHQLADSLADDDPLRRSWLSAEPVRAVLNREIE